MSDEPIKRYSHLPLMEQVMLFEDEAADRILSARVEAQSTDPERLAEVRKLVTPYREQDTLPNYIKALIAEAAIRTLANQNEQSLPHRIVIYTGPIVIQGSEREGVAGAHAVVHEGTSEEKSFILLSLDAISQKRRPNFCEALVDTVAEELIHFADYKQGTFKTRSLEELDAADKEMAEQLAEKAKEEGVTMPIFSIVEGPNAHDALYHGEGSILNEERGIGDRKLGIINSMEPLVDSLYTKN